MCGTWNMEHIIIFEVHIMTFVWAADREFVNIDVAALASPGYLWVPSGRLWVHFGSFWVPPLGVLWGPFADFGLPLAPFLA